MSDTNEKGDGPMEEGMKNGPSGNKGGSKGVIVAGVVAILVMATILGVLASRDRIWPPAASPKASAVLSEFNTTHMSVPASSVGSTATFYEWNTSGATVRFFVVLDGKGTIRTAFDECPMCYGMHMGFRQEGASMVENCCNMSFPLTSIGPGGKGCRPEYLPSTIERGRVMIAKTSIMDGAYMFRKGTEPATVEDVNMTTVAVPLSSMGTTARWYHYSISGAEVRFFAVKDVGGSVHTAFDECPKCYESHLGFRQDGMSMVENCCEMPFPIGNITAEGCNRTGCHPAFLPNVIDGERVMISKSSLAAGSYMFRMVNETAAVDKVDASTIAVALSSIGGTATWYGYEVNGTTVRFFVVKDSNGTVHAAMDICPKCYKKHAGFRQDGNSMVENCCNMPFAIDNITAEGCSGTMCHPAFLPSRIEGQKVMMAGADLEAGAYMFK